jgi:hypothetical protein
MAANALAVFDREPGALRCHGEVILRPACRPASCPLTRRWPRNYTKACFRLLRWLSRPFVAFARPGRRAGLAGLLAVAHLPPPPARPTPRWPACRRPPPRLGGRGGPHGGRAAAAVAAAGGPRHRDLVQLGGRGADRCRRWTRGRGLVLLTPHLGSFEVCAQAYAERFGARSPSPCCTARRASPGCASLEETARARPGLATRRHAGRRAADDPRAAPRRMRWACCPTRCRPRAWACGRRSSASRPTR